MSPSGTWTLHDEMLLMLSRYRSRREAGVWQEMTCHSSVLAAVSPVLRQCLTDQVTSLDTSDTNIVIISELGMSELLPLFYTGQVSVTTSTRAGEVWAGLAELGVEAGLEMRRGTVPAVTCQEPELMSSSVVTIMLGVEQDNNGVTSSTLSIPVQLTSDQGHTLDTCNISHVTPSDVSFTCDYCDSKFMTDINLSTHVADYHLEIKCKECDEIVKGNNNLIKHTVSKHPLYPDLDSGKSLLPTCDVCKETFVTNQALKFHQYKHTGVKPYKCKICDASFRTPSTLKSHSIQHEDCKNKCDICGLKCSTSGKLKIHMRTHTNEKPYQCSFCQSTFKQQSVLKVHEFTHTKKSNHKCDRCGMFFPTKSRLVKHRSKPICVTRNKHLPTLPKLHKTSDPPQLLTLDDLDSVYDNGMDKVTYFVQNESVSSDDVKHLDAEYSETLDYHDDTLDNLETSDIPVLVDNLPVIINPGIESSHLDTDNDEVDKSLEKHDEIMFSL